MTSAENTDHAFRRLPDLAARVNGGAVIHANDDFFADRAALVQPYPVQPHATFGYRGKVYDGWETRRRRMPGSDFAIVRLGLPGRVEGLVIDTTFFRGNHPPEVSVEATVFSDYPSIEELESATWTTILERRTADGDTANCYEVNDTRRWTHVRLTIYPDGGVARLRVHGTPVLDPDLTEGTIDLAAAEFGASIVACSNMFFSSPSNLLLPGPARNMGEGWENGRRRTGGNDWVVVRLAGTGTIRSILFDTSHYCGNAPGELDIFAACSEAMVPGDDEWFPVLNRRPVRPDTPHRLTLSNAGEVTHLKLNVYPDGGFARLRVWGELTATGRAGILASWKAAQ
jgi:allantoicase